MYTLQTGLARRRRADETRRAPLKCRGGVGTRDTAATNNAARSLLLVKLKRQRYTLDQSVYRGMGNRFNRRGGHLFGDAHLSLPNELISKRATPLRQAACSSAACVSRLPPPRPPYLVSGRERRGDAPRCPRGGRGRVRYKKMRGGGGGREERTKRLKASGVLMGQHKTASGKNILQEWAHLH